MTTPLYMIPAGVTDDATITCDPAAVAGLGAENLQISDRGMLLRVLGEEAHLTVDLAGPRRIGSVVLWRHNLDTNATWRVRGYDEPALAGNLVVDTDVMPALLAKTLGDLDWGIDTLAAAIGGMDYSYVQFGNTIVRSLLIDINAPGAASIEIGRLFAGRHQVLLYGYDWGSKLKWERERKATRTAAGGQRVEASVPWRRLSIDLSWIKDHERALVARMLRDTGSGRELWISARTAAGGSLEADHALLGYLDDDPDLIRAQGLRYTTSLHISES